MSFQSHRMARCDQGFGLTEVVIAMFLLAMISLSILPALIQGLKLSSDNVTIAAATQLADRQLDEAQSTGTKCRAVLRIVGGVESVDSRGVPLKTEASAEVNTAGGRMTACPTAASTYPTTVTVDVSVKRTDQNTRLVSASTEVYVDEY